MNPAQSILIRRQSSGLSAYQIQTFYFLNQMFGYQLTNLIGFIIKFHSYLEPLCGGVKNDLGKSL